jgi:hypothetical protein
MAAINMPSVRPKPEKEKEEKPIDKFIKGLSVAGGILGIGRDVSTIMSQSQQRGIIEDEKASAIAKAEKDTEDKYIAGTKGVSQFKKSLHEKGFTPLEGQAAGPGDITFALPRKPGDKGEIQFETWRAPASFKTGDEAKIARDAANKLSDNKIKFLDYWKPVVENVQTRINIIDETRSLLDEATDNEMATAVIKRNLAKGIGREVGVMTDQDVASFEGGKALLTRVKQLFSTQASGTYSAENIADIKQMLDIIKQVNIDKIYSQADRYSAQWSGILGMKPEQIKKELIQLDLTYPGYVPPDKRQKVQTAKNKPPLIPGESTATADTPFDPYQYVKGD